MAENSKISWTTHTFNGWWGCKAVSPGCDNCYAESWDKRWGGAHWGEESPRRMILGEWNKPFSWNAKAKEAGEPHRVFVSSMCDIYEAYDPMRPVVDQLGRPVEIKQAFMGYAETIEGPTVKDKPVWSIPRLRARIHDIIEQTPDLTYLLLTKRPQNIMRMVPKAWHEKWPAHVWTGTSPVDQATANTAILLLLKVPGRHFLSYEPAVGPIQFDPVRVPPFCGCSHDHHVSRIDWVIGGDESGPKRRKADPNWYRDVLKQCRTAGIPFFMKQLEVDGEISDDPNTFPEDLRVQELPRWR